MNTLRLTVDPRNLSSRSSQGAINEAAWILREGGLVAFPTETVYGLGASALNSAAAKKIFLAKQRPSWDPLIVHVADLAMLAAVADVTQTNACAKALMGEFWPGPLTLLLARAEAVPPLITAGRALVGVRIPAHPVARALIQATGLPIAAPSANTFGRISPTLAAHVLEDLDGRIDAVLDGGETTHGLESTVVDVSGESAIVYRPGVVSLEEIRKLCASVEQWERASGGSESLALEEYARPESLPSPGIGIRHYAPRARLTLIDGKPSEHAALYTEAICIAVEKLPETDRPIGVMLPTHFLERSPSELPESAMIYDWGDWRDLPQLAHRLFAGLRRLDAAGVSRILCPLPPAVEIGAAIRDRLLKAARNR